MYPDIIKHMWAQQFIEIKRGLTLKFARGPRAYSYVMKYIRWRYIKLIVTLLETIKVNLIYKLYQENHKHKCNDIK